MGSSSYPEAPMCDLELQHARQQTSDSWAHVFALVDKSDESMYKLRKQDLDNQYHVAMFFSSCLAMIVIDSYKWLTQEAAHSVIAHCLLAPPPNNEFISFHMAVIINALWFSSLALTLSAFVASYACSYYLREFRNLPQFEAKHLLAFRQMRYRFLHVLLSRRDKVTWKPCPRLSYTFRQHKSLRDTLQLALISGDWLEQDCSSFLDRNNADAIHVLLADALVWIDQKPTIEKSAKIIEAIFHCILDLDLCPVFEHVKDGLRLDEVARGGLAAVFYAIAKERLNTNDARLLASKRWLEEHAGHLPRYLKVELARSHLKCMEVLRDKVSHAEYGLDSFDGFLNDLVLETLTPAENGLASGTDLKKTLNFIERNLACDIIGKDPQIRDKIESIIEERNTFTEAHDNQKQPSLCAGQITRTIDDLCICKETTGVIWILLIKCLCGSYTSTTDLQANDGRYVVGYSTPVPGVSRANTFASDTATVV
ncbi:hypothetical protein APHAL10511_006844 [Amanita phalloides]|nr:hypothetical protein APHAL10511_006844 [Amanita phalloides]